MKEILSQDLETTQAEHNEILLQLDEAQEERRKLDIKLNMILKATIGLEFVATTSESELGLEVPPISISIGDTIIQSRHRISFILLNSIFSRLYPIKVYYHRIYSFMVSTMYIIFKTKRINLANVLFCGWFGFPHGTLAEFCYVQLI